MVALAARFLIPVVASDWWAGWCFGPRYATDLLPFLAWFLVAAWARIGARGVLRWAFGATVALALWVQVVGAFYYPVGNWDALPVDVDVAPERIWDWSDTQVLRSWRAGPAPPLLLNQWKTLLKSHPGAPHP